MAVYRWVQRQPRKQCKIQGPSELSYLKKGNKKRWRSGKKRALEIGIIGHRWYEVEDGKMEERLWLGTEEEEAYRLKKRHKTLICKIT